MRVALQKGHINVHSLIPSLYNNKNILEVYDVDILCASECWLHDGITTHGLHVSSFQVFRKDCVDRGGGICRYVRSGVLTSVIRRRQGLKTSHKLL